MSMQRNFDRKYSKIAVIAFVLILDVRLDTAASDPKNAAGPNGKTTATRINREGPKNSATDEIGTLIAQAKKMRMSGDLDNAEQLINKALRLKPYDAEVLEEALEVYFKLNKNDEVLELLDEAYRKNSSDLDLLELLVNWKPHPFEERLANALKLMKFRPKEKRVYEAAFDMYAELDRMDEAGKVLEKMEAEGFSNSTDYYFRKGRFDNYSKKYESALQALTHCLDNYMRHPALEERAYAYYKLKQYEECFDQINLYIKECKDSEGQLHRAYQTRAKLNFDLKNYSAAIKDYSYALARNTGFPESDYVKRAQVYIACNRLQEASDDLRSALRFQPLNAKAHQLLSEVFAKQGKMEDSKKESSIVAKYTRRNRH